jgi:hypothetical protein
MNKTNTTTEPKLIMVSSGKPVAYPKRKRSCSNALALLGLTGIAAKSAARKIARISGVSVVSRFSKTEVEMVAPNGNSQRIDLERNEGDFGTPIFTAEKPLVYTVAGFFTKADLVALVAKMK